jgi:hypothetical protein
VDAHRRHADRRRRADQALRQLGDLIDPIERGAVFGPRPFHIQAKENIMPKKVRILAATHGYQCDDVVLLPDDVAKALTADGSADAHKDAVAYALSVNGNKVIDATAATPDPLLAEIAELEAKVKGNPNSDQAAELQALLDAKRAELAAK